MDNQRILFILPALPDFVPYVYNYFKIAGECGRDYDVVCWNRRGDKEISLPQNYTVYNHPTSDKYSTLHKLREIYGFYRFVKGSIRGNEYHAVFTYTIADSIFFTPWLTRHYRGRYVFDIRDYSPMIDHGLTRWIIKQLLRYSAVNVISSEGFLRWLPKGFDYTVCHNTDLDKVRQSIENNERKESDSILHVLTIGALRNTDANLEVIQALSNYDGVQLDFVGDGGAVPALKQYCEENEITNVSFHGRYRKNEEDGFVRQCDVMNIVLPHDSVADYLMSNRFYLSVRFRKPMVVNEGCFQAEQVRRYGIGLVIKSDENLYSRLMGYWKELDWNKYETGCQSFLEQVVKDMCIWEERVKNAMLK